MTNGALALALVIVSQAGAAAEPAWKASTSEEGNFSVSSPSKPTEQVESVKTPDGPVEKHYTIAQTRDPVYVVVFADHDPLPRGAPEAALDAERDGLLASSKGEVRDGREVTPDGNPGKEVTIDVPSSVVRGGAVRRARIFVVSNRLDEVTAIEPASRKEESTSATAPFTPFELAGGPAPARAAGSPPGGEWEIFTSKEGGFSVLMPGKPVEQRKSVPSTAGPVELINYSARQGRANYLVNVTPLVEAALERGRDALLKDVRTAVARNMPGKVVEERDIELDGHRGVEFVIDAPEAEKMPRGATIKVRCYLVEKRLLQVMALIPKDQESSREVTKFFDSFKPIDSAEGPAGGAPKAKRKR